MARKYKQGFFVPKNPEKYAGNPNNIIFRSSWEFRVMSWFDTNNQVLSWSSEETIIPYISPVDGKPHRYFVDFKVKIQARDGAVNTYLIEVKPESQTLPPKSRKVTQKYINEVQTFGVNMAKWDAAKRYSAERGYTFKTLTEYDLGLATRK